MFSGSLARQSSAVGTQRPSRDTSPYFSCRRSGHRCHCCPLLRVNLLDTEKRILKAEHHQNNSIHYSSMFLITVLGSDNDMEFAVWQAIGTMTMVLFFAEVCLRVFAFGLRKYLVMPMHKLDIFCVAVVSFFSPSHGSAC